MKVKRVEGLKTYQLTKQLRQKSCDVSINASAQSAGDVI